MSNTIKVYANKTLNMSPRKQASQVAHAVAGLVQLGVEYTRETRIIVLEARNTRFNSLYESVRTNKYLQIDKGYTEVPEGTSTAFAYEDVVYD